jgi:hypothetical protein
VKPSSSKVTTSSQSNKRQISEITNFNRSAFRYFGCLINDIEKDYDLDEDIDDLRLASQSYEILESLDFNHMKRHIINCMASLIEVTEKINEMNVENKWREKQEKIDLIITENKVFSAAVSMMSQELMGRGHNIFLDAFPDTARLG